MVTRRTLRIDTLALSWQSATAFVFAASSAFHPSVVNLGTLLASTLAARLWRRCLTRDVETALLTGVLT